MLEVRDAGIRLENLPSPVDKGLDEPVLPVCVPVLFLRLL